MTWEKTFVGVPEYEYVSVNQHGMRYRHVGNKQICCAKMSANITDSRDLRDLILLSHHLNVPVHYNFETNPQVAYIEVVAKETVQEL